MEWRRWENVTCRFTLKMGEISENNLLDVGADGIKDKN